jgi:hypothetical protein
MSDQEIQKLTRKKELMLVLSEFAYELGNTDVGLHWQDIGKTATKLGMIKLRVEIEDAEYTRTIVEE